MKTYLLSLLLLMLLACKHSVEPQLEPIYLYPLAVGNTWTYLYTQYDTLGNSYNSYQSIVQVFSDTVIDGVLWYAQNEAKTDLITSKSDGIYVRSANTPILWYKQPSRQTQTMLFREQSSQQTYITHGAQSNKISIVQSEEPIDDCPPQNVGYERTLSDPVSAVRQPAERSGGGGAPNVRHNQTTTP